MTQPLDVLDASKQYQAWLGDLKARAMLQTHNQAQAMFRSVLKVVRKHMTTEQVLRFADALPPLPRGIFIEGWRPSSPGPAENSDAIVSEVFTDLSPHHVPPRTIIEDVFAVIADRSGPRIAATMREALPDVLEFLWPPSAG